MKELFIEKSFRKTTLEQIEQANRIIDEYQAQGFTLTLRQLYYQFVSRDLLPNHQKSYDKLSRTISDARLAGYVDWQSIEDRTRNLRYFDCWDTGAELLSDAVSWFNMDKWASQDYRVEVWIEKDALMGVIEGVCNELEVPYFACRGYSSQSEMWRAGKRFISDGRTPVVIHLGDHDPSGVDMTRDTADRLSMFTGGRAIVERIALNMDQIETYNPPPNPAKLTDNRAKDYISRYGAHSWELDALEPQVIAKLVKGKVFEYRDGDKWDKAVKEQEFIREELNTVKAKFVA